MSEPQPALSHEPDKEIGDLLKPGNSKDLQHLLDKYAGRARYNLRRDFDGHLEASDVDDIDFASLAPDQGTALGQGSAWTAAAGLTADEGPSERQTEYVKCLRSCIRELPALQRKIIRADLLTGDVADAGELARLFDTTRNSIYVSRFAARKNLKAAMQRHGFFDGEEKRA